MKTRPPLPAAAAALLFLLSIQPLCHAQQKSASPAPVATDSPERREALKLYDEYKMAQALPLLQKLAQENPRDIVIWERCGVAMVSYSATLNDPAQRKAALAKAREILLKVQAMGDDSNLCKTLISMIPPDGGDASFSPRKDVDAAMNEAEADFARGDFDKALDGYQRALILDPGLYTAALFSGDVRFKQGKNDLALDWYARAAGIDPDIETAYRYWGDSLMALNKMDDARAKYIEAIVAEPYAQRTWTGLSQWADKNNVTLTPLTLKERADITAPTTATSGTTTVFIGEDTLKDDLLARAWLAYVATRALWHSDKFKTAYPGAAEYRHTLAEEADALHALISALNDTAPAQKDGTEKNPAPSPTPAPAAIPDDLARLIKIDKAGLLEPFILINRADAGIAQDYPVYRKDHRDLIRRYLEEFVVPKVGN